MPTMSLLLPLRINTSSRLFIISIILLVGIMMWLGLIKDSTHVLLFHFIVGLGQIFKFYGEVLILTPVWNQLKHRQVGSNHSRTRPNARTVRIFFLKDEIWSLVTRLSMCRGRMNILYPSVGFFTSSRQLWWTSGYVIILFLDHYFVSAARVINLIATFWRLGPPFLLPLFLLPHEGL